VHLFNLLLLLVLIRGRCCNWLSEYNF